MISFRGDGVRLCDGITRRDVLRVGGLGMAGLSLADLLRADAAAAQPRKEKSCILFYLQGGQSHIDVWDMKPDAPEMIRGPFKPISTNVPGLQIVEYLPRLAKMADKYALIRSMTHTTTNHNPGGYRALTAGIPKRDVNNLPVHPDDSPNPGCVISALKPSSRPVPSYVQLSEPILSDAGAPMPGLGAGFLSARYEPLKVIGDPNLPAFAVDELSLPAEITRDRFTARQNLLKTVEGVFPLIQESPEIQRLDTFYQRAFSMVTSPEARKAFDLSHESAKLRERYGRNIHGQRLLLARRLIEAGVRMVSVYWGGPLNAPDDYWDTHKGNFPKQQDKLLPTFDQCFSALLEDLDQRGLLESTFVIAMGEFGRTPKIGQITANAGTDATGRDHWPFCYSLVVAGGGIKGGFVLGASDEHGAYPTERPVTPEEFLATIFHTLGLDLHAEVHDQQNRPIPIVRAEPVKELF
jgi:hypothetical protein